ncbi:MAG TPA: hypothetical protein VGD98_05495 [Ktedonobacteraceae bacterium]
MFDERFLSQPGQPEICTQLSACIPNFSQLSSADANFFRASFQGEELCYAHSWLYLLRAARNDHGGLGYKFVGNDMVASIGYRDHSFYIVHPAGKRRYDELIDLCMRIYNVYRGPIILKKVDQQLYAQLTEKQAFFIDGSGREFFEEEAFPEHILQLERLFAPTAEMKQSLQPFLKKVQRFERQTKLWAVPNVAWKEIESNPGFQAVLGYSSDKYKSYMQILQEASSARGADSRYRFCAYYDERATIHGLYVSELFQEGIMGLYCAVSARSFPGVTEWMDYDFFQQLFNEGIHTLYLGGSETEGVHGYVQKLLPVVPSYLMRPLLIHRAGHQLD